MPADALRTTVKHYAWGSPTALPALLNVEPDGRPQAELWVGAHPDGPSMLERDGRWQRLDEVIAADPEAELGEALVRRFGPHLPYLLKILTVEHPLSIQVHPDAAQAEAGYLAEERAGVPRDAPERRYRDPLPKPELLCALTPFRVLCGLRPLDEGMAALAAIGAREGAAHGRRHGYRAALAWLFHQDDARRHELVSTAARTVPLVAELAARHPGDIGCVIAMLLHERTLAPGEALYLPAGTLHAYLSGMAIEVQASSDTVLRAGLTTKPVDPDELVRIVEPEPSTPIVIDHDDTGRYRPPTPWFQLQRYAVGPDAAVTVSGPALLLGVAGGVRADEVPLTPGRAAWLSASGGGVTLLGEGTVAAVVAGDPAAVVAGDPAVVRAVPPVGSARQ